MRKALLVLGMHRSGTSAVAGTAARLGAAAPINLMPANSSNERGHWEPARIAALNDELLSSAGSVWHDWRAFDKERCSSLLIAGLRARAKQLLEEEFGAAELFVLKDPRICRIAPFWLEALCEANIAPLVVIPVRSPLEVARSLASRDGFSLEKGLLLWLRHVLDAERETHGLPRAIVTMEQFLGDWRASIKTIGKRLAIEWPSFDDAAAEDVDSFLSPDLKHQNAPDDSLPPIYAWAIDAYEAMLALRDNPKSRLARMALNEVGRSFEVACAFMGPAFVELSTKLRQVEAETAAIRAERDELMLARDDLYERLKRACPLSDGPLNPGTEDRLIRLQADSDRVRRTLDEIQMKLAIVAAGT